MTGILGKSGKLRKMKYVLHLPNSFFHGQPKCATTSLRWAETDKPIYRLIPFTTRCQEVKQGCHEHHLQTQIKQGHDEHHLQTQIQLLMCCAYHIGKSDYLFIFYFFYYVKFAMTFNLSLTSQLWRIYSTVLSLEP